MTGLLPGWLWFVLAAAGVGAGLTVLAYALLGAAPRLSETIAAALTPPPPATPVNQVDVEGGVSGRAVRAALPAARLLLQAGLPGPRLEADLRVAERSPITHLALAVALAVAAAVTPAAVSVPLALAGVGALPLWLWAGCGLVGFLVPNLRVRGLAARRREELRRAIGAVLDLTAIALAGGAGVEQALHDAAHTGTGWAFAQIRAALSRAATAHTDPWTALGRLGTDLGVTELVELGATLELAGAEGARVRATLTAKAATLRTHQQTSDEAAATSATERMALPVAALFAGYLIFIGYPALASVLSL